MCGVSNPQSLQGLIQVGVRSGMHPIISVDQNIHGRCGVRCPAIGGWVSRRGATLVGLHGHTNVGMILPDAMTFCAARCRGKPAIILP